MTTDPSLAVTDHDTVTDHDIFCHPAAVTRSGYRPPTAIIAHADRPRPLLPGCQRDACLSPSGRDHVTPSCTHQPSYKAHSTTSAPMNALLDGATFPATMGPRHAFQWGHFSRNDGATPRSSMGPTLGPPPALRWGHATLFDGAKAAATMGPLFAQQWGHPPSKMGPHRLNICGHQCGHILGPGVATGRPV